MKSEVSGRPGEPLATLAPLALCPKGTEATGENNRIFNQLIHCGRDRSDVGDFDSMEEALRHFEDTTAAALDVVLQGRTRPLSKAAP